MKDTKRLSWLDVAPIVSALAAGILLVIDAPAFVTVLSMVILVGAMLSAADHAETIGHRIGEPFGSLVLAVSVTVIEVGLIIALMSSGKEDAATLARDTVFAVLMLCCNGIVGITLIVGARGENKIVLFNTEGCRAGLATVVVLSTLTLVLPTFTDSVPGPEFTPFQLGFAAVASFALWAMYVFTQTVEHRRFFVDDNASGGSELGHDMHDLRRSLPASTALLVLSLIGVVGLAKVEAPLIERAVLKASLPHALVGVVIAAIVLLPEAITAVRAARMGRQQHAFNLAYGSAVATIGLTIPVLSVLSVFLPNGLHLGVEPVHLVLLLTTFVLSTLTIVSGQAVRLQGLTHIALVAAFVAMTIHP